MAKDVGTDTDADAGTAPGLDADPGADANVPTAPGAGSDAEADTGSTDGGHYACGAIVVLPPIFTVTVGGCVPPTPASHVAVSLTPQ